MKTFALIGLLTIFGILALFVSGLPDEIDENTTFFSCVKRGLKNAVVIAIALLAGYALIMWTD